MDITAGRGVDKSLQTLQTVDIAHTTSVLLHCFVLLCKIQEYRPFVPEIDKNVANLLGEGVVVTVMKYSEEVEDSHLSPRVPRDYGCNDNLRALVVVEQVVAHHKVKKMPTGRAAGRW